MQVSDEIKFPFTYNKLEQHIFLIKFIQSCSIHVTNFLIISIALFILFFMNIGF